MSLCSWVSVLVLCLPTYMHKSLYFFNNLLLERSMVVLSSDLHLRGTLLWNLTCVKRHEILYIGKEHRSQEKWSDHQASVAFKTCSLGQSNGILLGKHVFLR